MMTAAASATPCTRSLLEHFTQIRDTRQPCKVMYPLGEVLLLVVCGTIAACGDNDDIVLWGNRHLPCQSARKTGSSLSGPTHHCHIVETGNDSFRFKASATTPKTRKEKARA